MATVSYTYDLKCNENNVSQVKVNGTDVKRLQVNGKDVIHKFVTYKCTATIHCWIYYSSLKAGAVYQSCNDDYVDVEGTGYFFVSYGTSGDSLSDSGGSIPNVEVYFRRAMMLDTLCFHHETFSNLDPKTNQTFGNFRGFDTYSIGSDPFSVEIFRDVYSDGSELRTDWGNVNISAKLDALLYSNSETASSAILGSISKTFTRTVQEY